jgi:hypothetical protein
MKNSKYPRNWKKKYKKLKRSYKYLEEDYWEKEIEAVFWKREAIKQEEWRKDQENISAIKLISLEKSREELINLLCKMDMLNPKPIQFILPKGSVLIDNKKQQEKQSEQRTEK